MCGIFGFTGSQKHGSDLVFNGLKNLEYRGYDSWGIVADSVDGLTDEKYLGKILTPPKKIPDSNISIGHTRWATHGGITLANCHPHFDCHHEIALVHNGIVENYKQLKTELQSKKHKFISQTDTEVIIHLIEEYQKNHDFVESVRLAFLDLHGLSAIAAIHHQDNQLVVAKKGSPLVIGLDKDENYVASDINALTSLTDSFIFLEDDQLAVITPQSVKIVDTRQNNLITFKPVKISSSQTDIGLDGYPNYLSKEIHQQPSILKKIYKENLSAPIEKIIDLASQADQVFFTGCGSSYFAAYFNSLIVSQKINKPIFCYPASEFEPYNKFLTSRSLLVIFSQSGETIDAINLVNSVKKQGVIVASVVNTPYSTLHRLADICQILPCGPEKCVLSTKTFTAQIALFLKSIGENLSPAIKDMEHILKPDYFEKIKAIAQKLSSHEHIFIISRGGCLPVGHETALKIKEVSYIHAESFSGGELKHGAIALIEPGTPCLVIAPSDSHYNDVISSATEIKARGGWVIGISDKPDTVFDDYLPISVSQTTAALSVVVISQLLASQLCQIKGYDPDKPRNLAKSVTVK